MEARRQTGAGHDRPRRHADHCPLGQGGLGWNFKGGFGFHPLLAYLDETEEALAGDLRPGNAGANTAADQVAVCEQALEQFPQEHIEEIDILLRVDSAGATHELLDWCRDGAIRYTVGYDLTEPVRAAILALEEGSWVPALRQDDEPRSGAEVAEITGAVDLSGWPEGSRLIVRRERPHTGAQLFFTDHDGHRFQVILTDQPETDVALLERRHRARACGEDQIRSDKDTGLRSLPFRDFDLNAVWLELVLIAHDLIAWTKALLLSGELARAEPNACATGCCTSPDDSPSLGARSCDCRRVGPGRRTSPPPSPSSSAPASRRLTRPAVHDDHRLRRPAPRAACQATGRSPTQSSPP